MRTARGKDKICTCSISNSQSYNSWQPAVHKLKDKNDQPDTKDVQPQDQYALKQPYKQSHNQSSGIIAGLPTTFALVINHKTRVRTNEPFRQ